MVNRAFGSALGPVEIESLLSDEEIILLMELAERDQIDDAITYLRLLALLSGR